AFGSLLCENIPVRLSGQDSRRGTFSQRHSYWYDVETRERYSPLAHIQEQQARYCVYNSPLIEAGVLGFDYGYSLAEPNMLIIWEAQFGDFVNGAQVIIDQFITSSEAKWGRVSGLVMMLPHGQEGAGPEHSSARLERFLESCAEDNIQVAYCTTAAQHFHILRRQMHRDFRKPLILMTPKGHLRSTEASSSLDELIDGRFLEVIGDAKFTTKRAANKVKRVVLCTGKVAHELIATRDSSAKDDTAIVRIEQLYPWPEEQLQAIIDQFSKLEEVVWCQEEPQNFGAWRFVERRLRRLLGRDLRYAGRKACSVAAPGSKRQFTVEQQALLHDAIGICEA
ncbi:MAG: 2-oxoglutarate dehydrogenase E1 component, partial [Planctomycetota bacterium]